MPESEFEGFDTPQEAAAAASDEVKRQGPKQVEGPNDLPALVTASSLLPPEPEIPQDFDEDTPPAPPFIVVRNAYGPGAHSVKFADGTPVGVFVRENNMLPEAVESYLTNMGLDADLVDFFTRNRAAGIQADDLIMADPAVQAFAQEEDRIRASKEEASKAFIAAMKKKEKA